MQNTGLKIRYIFALQVVVMIYTLSGVAAKFTSGYTFMSLGFFFLYGLEILLLGIYALLWQQIIKKFPLSVAYANRSVAVLWSMIWAALFFRETITIKNLIGCAIVILGTIVVNQNE